jgi:hypothetical protein
MIRVLLTYILPLALPTAIYLIWLWYLRHRSKARGDELPEIKSTPVFASILIGFMLMFAALSYVAVTSGAPPGEGKYEAPRFEHGQITKPKFK